jgi:hypothetical protein
VSLIATNRSQYATVPIVLPGTSSVSIVEGGNTLEVNPDGSINVAGILTGNVTTDLNGLNFFQTSQYMVGLTAVQLGSTPLSNRSSLSVKVVCTLGAIIYIGPTSGVTTANGYPLFNGDSVQLDLTPAHQLWAVASAAGQLACLLEIGK